MGDLLFHGSCVDNEGLNFIGWSKLEGCYFSEMYIIESFTIAWEIYTQVYRTFLLEFPWQEQQSTRRSFVASAKGSQITGLDRLWEFQEVKAPRFLSPPHWS
jgi:hypothetical protein